MHIYLIFYLMQHRINVQNLKILASNNLLYQFFSSKFQVQSELQEDINLSFKIKCNQEIIGVTVFIS